jgi:O-antigen ligase
MITAIIIFSIFFLILALWRLDYAIYLLIAALPTYLIRFSIFGIPSTLLEVMILITFAVWFFKSWLPSYKERKKNNTTRIPYPFSREIIALIILSFISVGVSGFTTSALGIWKAYFFEPILIFILVMNICRDKKQAEKILWSFLLSAFAVSIVAIYQKITGKFIPNEFWANAATRRVVSFFGYPNAVGLYLAPLIPLFLGWFFSSPRRTTIIKTLKKLLIIAVIVASLAAIYFARSEGALIGIVVSLLVFGLFAGKKQRVATLGLMIIVIGGVFFFAPTKNFVLTKLTLHDLSGQIREQQWKETFQALKGAKIITGAGLANYQATVAPYHQAGIFFNSDNISNFDAVTWASSTLRIKYWQPVEIYLYPHNIFLNFWSEIGLLGALVFIWLMFKAALIAYKTFRYLNKDNSPERYLALGLMGSLICIFIHGLVDVPYFKNDLAVMFWIFIALIGLMSITKKEA